MRAVQAHRAGDHRGESSKRQSVARKRLAEQLPDPLDAEPDQVHIVGEQAVIAKPGFQPRHRAGQRDGGEDLVVAEIAHWQTGQLLVALDGFVSSRGSIQPRQTLILRKPPVGEQ